jgi:hypothetical protein
MKQTRWKTVGKCLKYAQGYGQGNGPRLSQWPKHLVWMAWYAQWPDKAW